MQPAGTHFNWVKRENETWTGEADVLRLKEKRSAHKRFVTKPTTARPVCGQTTLQCRLKVDGVHMWDRHFPNGTDSNCLLWRIWKCTFGFHERRRILPYVRTILVTSFLCSVKHLLFVGDCCLGLGGTCEKMCIKLQHTHLHILQHDQISAMCNDTGDQGNSHHNNTTINYHTLTKYGLFSRPSLLIRSCPDVQMQG